MENKITMQKQAFARIQEIKEDKYYKELIENIKVRHKNFIEKEGTEDNEKKLKDKINKLRNKVYPHLRKLPYHFVIKYYQQYNDTDFWVQYIYAISGRAFKTASHFLNQPINLYLGLYSFVQKSLLPPVKFVSTYSFKDEQTIEKNFDELKIFTSPKTKFISMLTMLSEHNGTYINVFEKEKNKIRANVIPADRDVDKNSPLFKEPFEYFRLKKEMELGEKWREIIDDWEKNIESGKGDIDEFNKNLEDYIKELEKDEEFKKLLDTFKSQFEGILTEKYVENITGEKDYDEGLKYFFWTFYFGTIRMILIKQHINNVYFLPIITGKEEKNVGGGVVLNTQYPIEQAHPVNEVKSIRDILDNSGLADDKIKEIYEIIDKKNFGKKMVINKENMLRNYQLIFSGYVDDHQMKELDMIDAQIKAGETAVAVIANNISHNLGSHALSYIKLEQKRHAAIAANYIENFDNITIGELKLYLELKSWFDKENSLFTGYLQERQEFISMFAMGVNPFYSSINFSQFIEKRFTENTLLLQYLAKSEGYGKGEIKINFKYPGSDKDLLEVNLPGGHLGTQAFFSILEQKIRNVAKHQEIDGEKIELEINIEDKDNEFYNITIKDTTGKATQSDIDKIQSSLKSDFLRLPEKSKEMGKGMQELFLMAAWLRGVTPGQLVLGEYEDHEIITAGKDKDDHLSLHFKISKPRQVLIISNEYKNDKLPKYWYLKKANEINNIQTYRLIIIDKKLNKEEKENLKKYLPVRQLEYDLTTGLPDFDALYEKWIQEVLEISTDKKILIRDDDDDIEKIKNKIDVKNIVTDTDFKTEEIPTLDFDIIYWRHYKAKTDIENKFIEATTGDNFTRFFINLPKSRTWYLQAIESALTKVIIFDERLYGNYKEEAKKEDTNKKEAAESYFLKFKNLNVCIVSIEENEKKDKLKILNLKNEEMGEISPDGEIKMKQIDSYHLISIHQGLLDRIFDFIKHTKQTEPTALTKEKLIKNSLDSLKTGKIKRIVVHSGRAILPQIPDDIAFVPYTSLENALRASKFNLTELLFSTNLK